MYNLSNSKAILLSVILFIVSIAGTIGVLSIINPVEKNPSQQKDTPAPRQAREVAEEGRRLLQEGKTEQALTQFEQAKKLFATEDNAIGVNDMDRAISDVKNLQENRVNNEPIEVPAPPYQPPQ